MSTYDPSFTVGDFARYIFEGMVPPPPLPTDSKDRRRQTCLTKLLDIQKRINSRTSEKERTKLQEDYQYQWGVCRRDLEPF